MLKKCTPLWREAHVQVKVLKTPHAHTTFERSDIVSHGRRLWTLSKVSKTWGFCSISKNGGKPETSEEDLERWWKIDFPWQAQCKRHVHQSCWFPERGCILELPIFRFAEMILHDRCSTSYDLVPLLRGRRNTLDKWSGKIAKRIGTRLSALHLTFHFWRTCCQLEKLRTSRRIASFLTLSRSKNEESRRIAALLLINK